MCNIRAFSLFDVLEQKKFLNYVIGNDKNRIFEPNVSCKFCPFVMTQKDEKV